jgi:hypothetical protein
MMEIVSLFKDRETRDELGIGTIRDGFADLLFPGTSTIQTRVHYFLFIPWIYRQLEAKRIPTQEIGNRLRKEEMTLIQALKEGESVGVIGQRVGASLNRFPSNIYWYGLRQWGILRFSGTQYQYHHILDAFYHKVDARPSKESSEVIDTTAVNWDSQMPDPPEDFPQKAAFTLNEEQADYLRNRLVFSCPNSMLSQIVENCRPVRETPYAWLHPQIAEFPQQLQTWLYQARNFSETLQGAALLYNLMLAEARDRQDWVSDYQLRITKWWGNLLERGSAFAGWDRGALWGLIERNAQVLLPTHRFVDEWLDLLLEGGKIANPINHKRMRELIQRRETWLKRSRSRFNNRRHLELWNGEAGTGQLDFRWNVGRSHSNEILKGLGIKP